MTASKRVLRLYFDDRDQQWKLIVFQGNIAQHIPLSKAYREWDVVDAEKAARRELRSRGIRTNIKASKGGGGFDD